MSIAIVTSFARPPAVARTSADGDPLAAAGTPGGLDFAGILRGLAAHVEGRKDAPASDASAPDETDAGFDLSALLNALPINAAGQAARSDPPAESETVPLEASTAAAALAQAQGLNLSPTPGLNLPPTPDLNLPPTPGLNLPPTPGLNLPPTPGLDLPPTQGLNLSPTQGLNLPPTPGLNLPPTPGLNLPPTQGLNLPPTPGLNLPPTPGLNLPPTPGLNLLPTQGLNPPPAPAVDLPPTQALSLPPTLPTTPALNLPPEPGALATAKGAVSTATLPSSRDAWLTAAVQAGEIPPAGKTQLPGSVRLPPAASADADDPAAILAVAQANTPPLASSELAAPTVPRQKDDLLPATSGLPSSTLPTVVHHDVAAYARSELQTPLRDPSWANDFSEKMLWFVGKEKQSAQLTLNPPQLGSIEITINIDKGNTTAYFASANAEVRGAIEAALPRLREMFADAGIQLGQASVGGESFRQPAEGQQQPAHQPRPMADNAILGIDSGSGVPGRSIGTGQGISLVDTFA